MRRKKFGADLNRSAPDVQAGQTQKLLLVPSTIKETSEQPEISGDPIAAENPASEKRLRAPPRMLQPYG